LKSFARSCGLSTAVGDEGGFANLPGGRCFEYYESRRNAGYKFGDEVKIALDCAAAEFFVDGNYDYKNLKAKTENSFF
jgi:enolase